MLKNIDLTKGNIAKNLFIFTLPILGTSFINITYNLVDMLCIGKLGSGAVAGIGTAGFFLWFANASSSMARIGASVLISQEYGKKNYSEVKNCYESAFWTNFLFGIIVSLILVIFNKYIINFFNLGDEKVIKWARDYLFIIGLSMPFIYVNPVVSAMFNSTGNSKTPFIINSTGLIFNIVFDIVLIFGLGPFPAMGVHGAAIATSLAQVLVFSCLMYFNLQLNESMRLSIKKLNFSKFYALCKIGFPSALQSTLYCIYSIILARIIADFGPIQIAVQKVGAQIESISWMSADGLAIAITAFVGQNFGIKNFDRIKKGIKTMSLYSFILGCLSTFLLIFFGMEIFKFFINETKTAVEGASYLKILGYSQLFMCFEIVYIGIFNGYAQTRFPAIISIILTGLRIPIALLLSKTDLAVDGIWIAISATTVLKGILIPLVFFIYQNRVVSKYI